MSGEILEQIIEENLPVTLEFFITNRLESREITVDNYLIPKASKNVPFDIDTFPKLVEKIIDFDIPLESNDPDDSAIYVTIRTEGNTYIVPIDSLSSYYYLSEQEYQDIITNLDYIAYEIENRTKRKERELLMQSKCEVSREFLANCLQQVYPDKWDIGIDTEADKDNIKVTIHFPEVTVTNSKDQFHKIYDVFVRFHFDENLIMTSEVTLMRTTVTDVEFYHGYSFSHTSRCTGKQLNNDFRKCCYGSGTEIAMAISEMSLETNKLDENDFCAFLYLLSTYVSWESLEGGPYFRMENLVYTETNNYSKKTVYNTLNSFLPQNLFNNLTIYYDYTINSLSVTESSIRKNHLFIKTFPQTSTGIIARNECIRLIKKLPLNIFRFRDQDFSFKVIVEDTFVDDTLKIEESTISIIKEYLTNLLTVVYIENREKIIELSNKEQITPEYEYEHSN